MFVSLLGMGCSSDCDSVSDGPETIGELGNGTFHFDCVGATDPACDWTVGSSPQFEGGFPSCLVVGGQFRLDYTLRDLDALDSELDNPLLFIEPASEAYVRRSDPFETLREGRVAMFARADDQIVDFIHFDVIQPDAMAFTDQNGSTIGSNLEIAVNERRFVRVVPTSAQCGGMGGTLPLTATSSDSSVVEVASSGVLDITGRGLGTATLTVELGNFLSSEITVVIDEVGPGTDSATVGSTTDPTTGDTDTDTDGTGTGGTDTDTDTDAGTDGSTGSTGTTGGA
jgi:hypothetical protein